MSKIVPAILVDSLDRYRQQLRIVRQLTNRFQLDLIDQGFADNQTISADQVDPVGDLQIDVDLMSSNPSKVISNVFKLRPKLIIFHFFEQVDLQPLIERTKSNGISVGLALEPDQSADLLKPYLEKLDLVQLMGHKSGYAKLPLDEAVLTRAAAIKALKPSLLLSIDGGVGLDNLAKIVDAGIDIINVNTYIFDSPSPIERYHSLLEALS